MILQSFRHFLVFSKIWRKRKHSRGHVACSPSARGDLSVWALGTHGALGKYPGGVSRLGHSGHVATRATSGGTLPAWVLGTRVALGGFRGNYHSLDSRHTRGLPGGSYVYGYSGHVALSEAKSERGGVSKGGFEGVASGLAFGTPGMLRRAPKEGYEGLSG